MIITRGLDRKDGTTLIGDKYAECRWLINGNRLMINLMIWANKESKEKGFSFITNFVDFKLRYYIELTEEEMEILSDDAVEYFLTKEINKTYGKGTIN